MSDKSFGDCPSRNIVKNPLLSTAVTGLSIEDLTHNAVLVPVAANQGLITRSEHQIGSNVQTLAHTDHEYTNFPSGDSNTNVYLPQATIPAYPHPLDHPLPPQNDQKRETSQSTVSKASAKSEDDFDVNEYFARLQGTRYVSAPINSNPDQNANLTATEENLEEINLNDDKNVEVQQSLTADIAQNFSQLPTVLPHVASAVFSSFSNMLNYKSREQTPDDRVVPGYQDVSFQIPPVGPSFGQNLAMDTPLMAEDVVKEVAPPPKEPPIGGTTNYRITTRKKYAQIPGLSSGQNIETVQQIAFNPLTQNVPSYFVPAVEEKNENKTVEAPVPKTIEQIPSNAQETFNRTSPIDLKASDFQPNAFNAPKETLPNPFEEKLPPPPSSFVIHDIHSVKNAIPPPPMFSSQKREPPTGKAVLPPSVARRIGSNHPVIKPQTMQLVVTDKILVPTFDPTAFSSDVSQTQPNIPSFGDPLPQSSGSQMFGTNLPTITQEKPATLPPSNIPSIPTITPPGQFIPQPPPGFGSQPLAPATSVIAPPTNISTRLPPQKLAAPPVNPTSTNISAPPIFPSKFPPITPSIFAPIDVKSSSGNELSQQVLANIFSPMSSPAQLPIETIKPPIAGSSNIGPTLFSPQSTSTIAPPFFNPTNVTEPKLDQPFTSEPPKPLIQPPKATEGMNFRMVKKKPQYYSGPIEGVGSISNSIKPVIEPVVPGTFQGAMFTPEQPQAEQSVTSSIPFDISKQLDSSPLIPQFNEGNSAINVQSTSSFDTTKSPNIRPQYDITNPIQNYEQFNTAFDMSRPTTDSYERKEETQEPKGFGIIGSLKSKLSGIDINKLQHSVTSFFDPAFNDTKKDDPIAQKIDPYGTVQQPNNIEIFVPIAQTNAPGFNYDYEQHKHAVYVNSQYYRYPNFQNQGQPQAGHCSNYNHYPSQTSQPDDAITSSIPEKVAEAVISNEPETPILTTPLLDEPKEPSYEKPAVEKIVGFESEVTKLAQNVTTIEETSAISFFDIAPIMQPSLKLEDGNKTDPAVIKKPIGSQAVPVYGSPFDTFETSTDKMKLTDIIPISIFDPKPNDPFVSDIKETQNANFKAVGDMFVNKNFDGIIDKQNLSNYGAQTVDLFSNTKTIPDIKKEENSKNFFAAIPVDNKAKPANEHMKTDSIFTSPIFDKEKEVQMKDSILEYLKKDDVPILGVSSVPLFGLSTIVADKLKDFPGVENISSLADRTSSMSFFDHPHKPEECTAPKHIEILNRNASFSFFENTGTVPNTDQEPVGQTDTVSGNSSASLFEKIGALKEDLELNSPVKENVDADKIEEFLDKNDNESPGDIKNASDFNMCETCREVNKPEDQELDDQDVTNQLIENITSPIQLSNPVEALLTESGLPQSTNTKQMELDAGQFDEISHITEETIETIQVQSATDLLEDVDEIKTMNYGWANKDLLEPDYSFNIDPNSIGFFGSNSLFFDNVPTNAEEIKHHEDLLARKLSAPSAPPEEEEEEEDSKSDEGGILDVHSIEQDANKDFPLFEEFVIEPSDNDDDKLDYKQRSEDKDLDSFTNRVEKYKQMDLSETTEAPKSLLFELTPQPIGMASYFDTGNFAADNHYRITNTLPSSTTTPSIPPGFEEEFRKRLALAKLKEEKLRADIKKVPETSTQTRTTTVVSYSVAQNVAPTYSSVQAIGFNVEANVTKLVDDLSDDITVPTNLPPKPEIKEELKLPDPKNFFSDDTPENKDTAPENFSRLASYFSSPPKTEHAKSFFELSQSQNHYRHASETNKYIDLMKDLTSIQNITAPKDQTIRHVNYFTVEYDSIIPELNKGDINKDKDDSESETDKIDIDNVLTNCRYCATIFDTTFKVRSATNDNSDAGATNPIMEGNKEPGRGSVTVNFDGLALHEEPNEGVAGMTENRATSEYTPVKHHWFYRVDVEDKSIWRGFSVVDSRALETAYLSSDLDDQTLVATDGGRYDVNVMGRLRIPVYWSDKPTNVRRCSWFYKGATDARYVPYTEPTAEKLEEEYRHGMTTGEWHRRLVLPNGEVVVMHGPSVMVHFLHSDAFSSPPLFSFGKRVYRNPPKIRVSRDQPEKIDHLILLVHGAGEYKCQKDKIQSTSRPRVVRRGHDESEIEDTEPSSIDHLLLLCHGVGSACDMRFRSVEEVVEDFRATSLQLIQSHYRNSYDQGVVSRVEVLPISWHATLHSGETGVDRRLAQITLDSIPRLRSFTNDTVLDVLFYTSPVFCQTIIDTVCKELNRIYSLFVHRNPSFKGGISLGGHSLGSVILYDLLCHQQAVTSGESRAKADKQFVTGPAGTGQLCVQYPCLAFSPDAMYALGSPIAIFECIRGVESLGAAFSLPTCKNFFNIFHPYDPIAYRIEPLIDSRLRDLKPFLIPHHKGRKRMHLELKDTMARVGADLKQKLLESLKSTWNKWKAQPPTDGQLEKVVEEEMEKEHLCDDSKEELARENELSTPEMLGRLNSGRRVDYVLQEAPLEMINEYIFAMSSHVGYWESEDTMLLMLREIYSSLGVQPDSTVPQQNMTVQRTRAAKQEETIVLNASEFPSTSHGTSHGTI